MNEEVTFVRFVSCGECKKILSNKRESLKSFISDRVMIPRCRGCKVLSRFMRG